MSAHFHFKQFTVRHDLCAMKVGTDGVLLGALADPQTASSILDIGTGCGLLALMMAQKCTARITGIDIDGPSAAQAGENAARSPWNDRMEIMQAALQEYAPAHPGAYDLIISNPPFFRRSLKSPELQRNRARHDADLSFSELLPATRRLLTTEGVAWFILPAEAEDDFLSIASSSGLYPDRKILIYPRQGKAPHRSVLRLTSQGVQMTVSGLTIRHSDGSYTEEYRRLCEPFYLSL